MSLTRRGWVVAALAVALVLLAQANGARSLNAVVAPALVALAASFLQVRLRDRPAVDRRAPDAGVVGDVLPVEVDVSADRPFGATIDDRLGDGLTAEGLPAATTVGDGPLRYDLRLWRRGERSVGPLALTVEGLFGLARTTFHYNDIDAVLAYPKAYRLDPSADALDALPAERPLPGTDEFDGLREYRRGDSRRSVHWKSSAKRPDEELLVRQYASTESRGALTVGVSPGERDSDVASAAASLVLHLLDAGFEVGLAAPDATLDPATGRPHRRAALAALARLGPGTLPDAAAKDADLVVRSAGGDVVVAAGDDVVPFDRLVATRGDDRVRYERPIEGDRTTTTDSEVVA